MCVYHALSEHIVEESSGQADEALKEADNLANLITEPLKVLKAKKLTTEERYSSSSEFGVSAGGEISALRLTGKLETIRDLINIFTQAFFHAQRRSRDRID
jgi:hypothetical protein